MSTANALAMEECLQKIADDREVFKEVTEGSAYKNNQNRYYILLHHEYYMFLDLDSLIIVV